MEKKNLDWGNIGFSYVPTERIWTGVISVSVMCPQICDM